MSAFGTKQTWACALHMSAFDPKRTSRGRGTGVVFVTFEPVTRERSLHTRCFLQSLQLKAGFIEAFAKTG
jgi:hypothetical protein